MPMFIPCIDDYFSQKQRDLYFVVFGQGRYWRISPFEHKQIMANPIGREELLAWFAEHLPETGGSSKTPGIQQALSNAYLKSQGLFALRDGWIRLHHSK